MQAVILLFPLTFLQTLFPLHFHKDHIRADPFDLLVRNNIFLISPLYAKHLAGTRNDQTADSPCFLFKIYIADISEPFPVTDVDHFLFPKL